MPSFHRGRVVEILDERPGLQRLVVDLGEGPERAYVLTDLIGPVAEGDDIVLNTTAVELGLGTGGWHFVHWNLSRDAWSAPGPGHIMKLRYTSLQADTGCAEESEEALAEATSIDGMPVVACPLHSHLAAAAAAFKDRTPDARLVYVMTDGAALPLALSHLVADLRSRGLLDATVTCGHAFGGDREAINVHSGLAVARRVLRADAVLVGLGPGIVGTNTALGHTGLDAAIALDAAAALGGFPIAALRVSFADQRERHQGVSHHSRTALGLACHSRVTVALPAVGGDAEERIRLDLERSGVATRHHIAEVDAGDVVALLADQGLDVSSMGRKVADDPVLHACAAAAGILAAERVSGSPYL